MYELMFRYKPYTKCAECLSNTRLKCKKCMQAIIESAEGQCHPRNVVKVRHGSPLQTNKYTQYRQKEVGGSSPKLRYGKENEKVVIISKYDLWMEEQRRKRSGRVGASPKDMWPKKAKFSDVNL
jgi:hypothetical protein